MVNCLSTTEKLMGIVQFLQVTHLSEKKSFNLDTALVVSDQLVFVNGEWDPGEEDQRCFFSSNAASNWIWIDYFEEKL